MPIDPQIETLGIQLADTAARNTATSIIGRIAALRKAKRDNETINELEEMIHELLSDKNELTLIAQAYEQELVAQRISEEDVEYVSQKFMSALQNFVDLVAQNQGQDVRKARQMLQLVQPLLSVEIVTVMQLVGFNFRKAIGEPLTELISRIILSKTQTNPVQLLEVQRVSAMRDNTFLEIARDPEAYERLVKMQTLRAQSESDA